MLLDKIVPMLTKKLLKLIEMSSLSNVTRSLSTMNSFEYFASDFLLPIIVLRMFHVSLVLALHSSVSVYNCSFFSIRNC